MAHFKTNRVHLVLMTALMVTLLQTSCAPQKSSGDSQSADKTMAPSQTPLMLCFETVGEASSQEQWSAARDACAVALELAPNVPALHLAAAGAEASLGNEAASLAHLETVVQLGATSDLTAELGFAEVLEHPEFQAVANRLRSNGRALPQAEVIHRFGDFEFWPEGIALDARTGDLFVGSIERRAVFRLSPDGTLHEFGTSSQDGLLEVLGLWVDSDRRTLWAATGLGEYTEPLNGPPRKNELVRYNIETGKLEDRYEVPDEELRLLNDVVVGPDGTAWATETLRGEVYCVRPGEDLELYRRFPDLFYLNGIAISGDGRTLYLGHYDGLSAVNLEDGSIQRVRGENMALGMVDGLSWIDDQLVIVQNSRRVNFRVVRVGLEPEGRRAVELEVLPAGVPEGLIPYTCAVGNNSVFVVAGAPFQMMDADETPPAPAVVKMPLSAQSG